MNNMNLPSDVSAKTGLPTFIVAVAPVRVEFSCPTGT